MRGPHKFVLLGLTCLIVGGGSVLLPADPSPTVTFLSVGQGDCIVLKRPGLTAMIDTGPSDAVANRAILPKLRKMGIDSIDLLVITHPDLDHVGGYAVLARKIPIGRVVISREFQAHPELLTILRSAPAKPIEWLSQPTGISCGNTLLRITPPRLDPGEDDNQGSLIVRIDHQASSVLLCGDIGANTEAEVSTSARWDCDILQAGHHGSKTSTSSLWLSLTRPRYVVMSCGRNNSYGHPSPETLRRVEHFGAKAITTAHSGDISFRLEADKPELAR